MGRRIKTPKKETHSLPIDQQIEQDNVAQERNPKKQKEKKKTISDKQSKEAWLFIEAERRQ